MQIAVFCRQYLRARDADDEPAMRVEASGLGHFLGSLLNQYLKNDSRWDSSERWIDGMVGASIDIRPPHVVVRGMIVWGRVADAGGPQWREPFEAQLGLTPDMASVDDYLLRFGNPQKPAQKIVFGLYETLADADGRIAVETTPGVSQVTDADRAVDVPLGDWAYEFRRLT